MRKFYFRLSSFIFLRVTHFCFPKSIFHLCVCDFVLIVFACMNTSPGVHSVKHGDFLVTIPLKTMRSHTKFIIMSTVLH